MRLEPLGSRIRLGKLSFQVIGLLEAKGQSSMGTDQDDLVLLPAADLSTPHLGKPGHQSHPGLGAGRGIHGKGPARHRAADARAPAHRVQCGRRLQCDGHEGDHADAHRHHAGAHGPVGGGGGGQPAGRRHRHHEHHARVGHGAHAGDRHAPGHRGPGTGGAHAVPCGGGGAVLLRRPVRDPAGPGGLSRPQERL